MLNAARRVGSALCIAAAVAVASGAGAGELDRFVGEAALAKIRAALPTAASAKPAAPRKVLVLTESARDLDAAQNQAGMKFVPHPSAPHCALAAALMGEKTGAYQATLTSDPAAIAADRLSGSDAVVLANVYLEGKLYEVPRGPNPRPVFAARQKALLDFVKGGKGLVGIHNATCTALGCPEYQQMIGATHHGHAWYAHQEVPIKLDDPASPLNVAFGGKGFTVRDDIYAFADPYSREDLHVLLSVDLAKAPKSMTAERLDGDYPVSWLKPYGTGRVFYTALGHEPATFQNAAFLRHLLDGIQFAVGDLKADASPGTPLPPRPDVAVMAGWTPLFDGKDLSGWQVNPKQAQSWKVEDGIIRYDGKAGTLRTKKAYRNYMLRVDWRLPRKADSGVFVRDDKQLNIWTWHMGSGEMWEHRGGFKPKTPGERNPYIPATREDRPVGEWNTFLITCQDDKVTVVLNGKEVISQARLLGARPRSPIGLQRHGDPIEFKSIYIKELP